jgi:hypothetical protein
LKIPNPNLLPTRTYISSNEIDPNYPVEVLPIVVDFSNSYPLDTPSVMDSIFGLKDQRTQLNAYFDEISHGFLQLSNAAPPNGVRVTMEAPRDPQPVSGDYSWGGTGDEIEDAIVKKFVLDAFAAVLKDQPDLNFQDKLVLLIMNNTDDFVGRTAMCLVPGMGAHPESSPPDIQELFVTNPKAIGTPANPQVRTVKFIASKEDFADYASWDDYIRELSPGLYASHQDQFVRGLCIFTRTAALSCAAHDVLHAVRRLSDVDPTLRGRALPCLYNLSLQDLWFTGNTDLHLPPVDRSVCCSPYVGWWDNIGDHLHPTEEWRNEHGVFFAGPPYGVCSFTKSKLLADYLSPPQPSGYSVRPPQHVLASPTMIPYVGIAGRNTVSPFKLAPLAKSHFSMGSKQSRLPLSGEMLWVKIPLDDSIPEYLLVEYRRQVPDSVDSILDVRGIVDIVGAPSSDDHPPTNPPADLIASNPPEAPLRDGGLLIYHVNESKRQSGCPWDGPFLDGCPREAQEDPLNLASNKDFVENFIIYLYTPSMMTGDEDVDWSTRDRTQLANAAFQPGTKSIFVLHRDVETIQVFFDKADQSPDGVASIRVQRVDLKTKRKHKRAGIRTPRKTPRPSGRTRSKSHT